MAEGSVDATFYAQVEPEWGHVVGPNGRRKIWAAKVVRITQGKPERPVGGTVLVKLIIRVPEAAFHPLEPEAVVVIPAALTEPQPIEVEATAP